MNLKQLREIIESKNPIELDPESNSPPVVVSKKINRTNILPLPKINMQDPVGNT